MGPPIISRVLSSSIGPISAVEFADAVFSTWRRYWPHGRPQTNIFGLAISGGVDSMALAALCSRMQQAPMRDILYSVRPDNVQIAAEVLPELKFQAFVVDHGVREDSDAEARAVSSVLEQRGIETKVLKIDWGPYERPAELPNFETLARKHRFQILGKACRDNSIDSLFLGHHQDDQAETVLMRLISGHRMFGLGGIRHESEIPECYGIHGVHESGGSSSHETPRPVFSVYRRPEQEPAKGYTPPSPLPTETGGIRVYRPLLGFTKDRLTATCKADDMKWFEDHTNKDPTLTSRNAIRHIYSSHAMPAALSVPSLVNLAQKFEAKHDLLLHKAKASLRGTIQSFSNRSGIITVELPSLSHLKDELSRSDIGLVAALILRQLVQYVTPDEQVHLQSFHGAISRVFPELSNNDNTSESKPTSFTVSGVQFKPLPPSFTKQRAGKKWAWLISRQPYNAALPRPGFQISPPVSNPPVLSWTPWTLYDGRFWIRVQNRSERVLVVRPFEEGDLMGFRHRVGLKMHDVLKETLRRLAPEGIRWTLPAIVIRSENGKERVLALPTLGISVLNSAKDVGWEVRYKKVDMEMLDGEIGTGV